MITKNDWIQFFPYKEVRQQQEESINFILNNFQNKRYVILELPTGVGKSAIAITVAKYFDNLEEKSAWIVTPQRVLQKQYQNDFKWLPTIWSKEHYECPGKDDITCPMGTLINGIYKGKYCDCPYKQDKRMFLGSPISLTNIAFFLNHVEYSNEISTRKVLIVDEAHNLESVISDFVSVTLNKYVMENLGINWIGDKPIEHVVKWIETTLLAHLEKIRSGLEDRIKLFSEDEIINGGQSLKQFERIERLIGQLNRCISRFVVDEWVMSINKECDEIVLRPIFASKYSYNQLFCKGEKVLLMSGTILDKNVFCRNVGIPMDDTEFLSLGSPFEKQNRAVIVTNVCSLSYKNIDNNLPKIADVIYKLINSQHKNEKGIIHCNSYKIANYITKKVRHKNRFIVHDATNRIEMYELHLGTKEPTILVSPSLTEGIDLYDDLSRFQIIVKTPFPYLGDNYITTKMERIPGWYEWETTKTIIQASGRSVRNSTDHCVTYILDSDFTYFYKKNSNLFPQWYKDALMFI